MILSYQAGLYGRLYTLNSRIRPLFQILDTEERWCNNSGGAAAGAGAEELIKVLQKLSDVLEGEAQMQPSDQTMRGQLN